MPKPPNDKTSDDGSPREEISDDELTRPLRKRRPTVAPPPAPAGIKPQAPPSAPSASTTGDGDVGEKATEPPRKRRPTVAPPPAPDAIQPVAPPSAPAAPAAPEATKRERRPTMAPPPASGSIRPTAPPMAPVAPPHQNLFDDEPQDEDTDADREAALLSDLSAPARALMEGVAGLVPMDSSFDFSQRITDHLVSYWEARRDHLITDEDGELEKDYVASLRIAKSIIVGSLSGSIQNLVEAAKSISDELDSAAMGYYARNLPANELRVVQSFHDLAVSMMFYKVSFHVEDPADRQVMLASSMGAQGLLEGALDWFAGLAVPEVISSYAGLLKFKIEGETRRDPR